MQVHRVRFEAGTLTITFKRCLVRQSNYTDEVYPDMLVVDAIVERFNV